MTPVFISYRRKDGAFPASVLCHRIQQVFGRQSTFLDVENLWPGEQFRDRIEKAIKDCRVVLVVIGDRWLRHGGVCRLDNQNDFVRFELETAHSHGKTIIPVLVGDAQMPSRHDLPDSLAWLCDIQAARLVEGRFLWHSLDDVIGSLAPPLEGWSPGTHHRSPLPQTVLRIYACYQRLFGVYVEKRKLRDFLPAEIVASVESLEELPDEMRTAIEEKEFREMEINVEDFLTGATMPSGRCVTLRQYAAGILTILTLLMPFALAYIFGSLQQQ